MILIDDYSRTEILISNLWLDWYVPKFNITMEVSEPYLTIYWFAGQFDTKVQKRVIDYRDVSGYGYANPTSASDLKSIIEGFIDSAWTNIGPGGDVLVNAGDLLTHDATSDTILPIGSNEYILQVNTALPKKLNWVGVNSIVSATNIGAAIASSSDATPNNSDHIATEDAGFLKKITWTNAKAFLKTYFDTIYTTTSAVASQITTALTGYLTSATAASTYQPLDSDLTTIAGLTATTDNFIQSKSSAWSSRTLQQVKDDLANQFSVCFWVSNTTISSLPSTERFFGNSNRFITKVDLANYSYVRLVFRVTTASSAGAAPRFRAKYRTALSTTISDYSDIGTSEVSGSLAATGIADSGWIPLAAGAKINDCFITIGELGGDGTGSPVIAQVYINFK